MKKRNQHVTNKRIEAATDMNDSKVLFMILKIKNLQEKSHE